MIIYKASYATHETVTKRLQAKDCSCRRKQSNKCRKKEKERRKEERKGKKAERKRAGKERKSHDKAINPEIQTGRQAGTLQWCDGMNQ
mmetsp:Transcript_16740/g.34024  ORF Transcript_16740/g.34024 Transcript_16740/m.34024 type:complete len:88 (+) Transcript_16740:432-695(+)